MKQVDACKGIDYVTDTFSSFFRFHGGRLRSGALFIFSDSLPRFPQRTATAERFAFGVH
jgi:hypothetical protein